MRFPNQNPEVFRVRQERGTSIDEESHMSQWQQS